MIILRLLFFNNYPDSENKKNINLENDKNDITEKNDLKKKEVPLSTNDNNTNQLNSNSRIRNIKDFRKFVELFYINREGIIHSKLYNDAKLVSFKEGKVVLNIENVSDKDFIRTISKLISKWTGRIWQISSSSSNLCKSLYEEDIINQQKEIELMKNNTIIKKVLSEIPGSKIHSISELSESSDSLTENNDKKRKEK